MRGLGSQVSARLARRFLYTQPFLTPLITAPTRGYATPGQLGSTNRYVTVFFYLNDVEAVC